MKNFTENTRVQVPAALHLCKLGYTYLDDITSYNPQANILTDIFIRSVKRLNPELTDLECSQLLDKIVSILNNDDLGKEFYTMLSSNSGIKLIDFVDIKENFDSTNDRYLRELNRTADIKETKQDEPVGNAIIEDKEEIIAQMKEIKSVLFNFTCDNPEEFRQEIDEIEDKDRLYELRSVLNDAKAILNQIRAFGDDELKEKIDNLAFGGIPTLITEVTHRIDRMNLFESTEHKADVSGIINVALSELEFEFKKGMSEELRIIVNDIRERCEKVQTEFEANFDRNEEKYVILADEFRAYFRKKGFIPQNTQDAKESIDYMNNVMKKIREINRRNNLLKKKYKGDERFVRVHKRIEEENQTREQPIISAHEYEIAENLSQMKSQIDNMLFLNINILDNEDAFKRDVLAIVGHKLIDLGIKANLVDRKYINNLITTEYFQQRNFAY